MTQEKARPPAPFALRGLAALAYAMLYVPLLCVLAYSFLVPGDDGARWGLAWYGTVWRDEQVLEALGQSLRLALSAAALAVAVGLGGTLAMGRRPGRWGRWLGRASLAPLVMPEVVLGVSSLLWFSTLGWRLGFVTMLMAHVTLCVAYAVSTLTVRYRELDPRLEEAARDLGASPRHVFARVVLPQMVPSLVAAFLMAFTVSFDDFLVSFFTAGIGTDTLPLKLYGMIKFGKHREIYALSVLLLASSTACLSGFLFLRRFSRISA